MARSAQTPTAEINIIRKLHATIYVRGHGGFFARIAMRRWLGLPFACFYYTAQWDAGHPPNECKIEIGESSAEKIACTAPVPMESAKIDGHGN